MADRFSRDEVLIDSPAASGFVITANDTVNLEQTTRGIYVGVAGDIGIQFSGYFGQSNVNILFTNVPVGILPVRADRVHAANTTATGLIGLY